MKNEKDISLPYTDINCHIHVLGKPQAKLGRIRGLSKKVFTHLYKGEYYRWKKKYF